MLPVARNEFVREPGWPVMFEGVLPNAIVMATLVSGASVKANGSENTAWPIWIVTEAEPANVSATSVEVLIAPPVAAPASATWTAFIVTGPLPNSFDSRSLSWLPLIDVNTNWRSVLLVRPGAGGLFAVSVSCGPVAQVPTQFMAPPVPPVAVVPAVPVVPPLPAAAVVPAAPVVPPLPAAAVVPAAPCVPAAPVVPPLPPAAV